MRLIISIVLISLTQKVVAQNYFFKSEQNIPVEINGKTLLNPWAGGLNSAQVSKVDMNGDNVEDLLVFDKTTNKLSTFIGLQDESKFKYDPKYESLFPKVNSWVLLVDFNQDGKKDLFCGANGGNVKVYKNNSPSTGNILFELVTESLNTEGLSGQLPLYISLTDVPSIVDIDNDGDLDVITFDPSGGHYVQLHKNLSMEKTDTAGKLDLKRIGNCWGNFMKGHSCTETELGVDCGSGEGLRTMHAGATVLALDVDGDGDKDLITGGVECSNINLLLNGGTITNANFISSTPNFPSEAEKPEIKSFLASFFEDVDFDGKKDLIVSPNLAFNEANLSSFEASIWYYKNEGSNTIPDFRFQATNFLQKDMIELGEYSYPALFDMDGDGDLDLFVGNRGRLHNNTDFYSTISLFENVGSKESPAFKLINSDYLNFSSKKYHNIKPSFTDINKDGKKDFVFSSTNPNNSKAILAYIINTGSTGLAVHLDNAKDIDFPYSDYDSPILVDTDNDGDLDILIGKSSGRLEYYENIGSNENFSFSLKNNKAGGVDNNIIAKNLFPVVANLDRDGLDELILTDRNGSFKIITNWKQELSAEFTSENNFLYNEFKNEYEAPFAGRELFPSIGDLNNDGFPEMVVGSVGGGLIFLKNEKYITGVEEEKKNGFELFPNPSKEKITIKSLKKGKLQVYSITGQKIFERSIPENSENELDISFLPKGIYIFTLLGPANPSVSRKFIKE